MTSFCPRCRLTPLSPSLLLALLLFAIANLYTPLAPLRAFIPPPLAWARTDPPVLLDPVPAGDPVPGGRPAAPVPAVATLREKEVEARERENRDAVNMDNEGDRT
ncbi:uncharacterized protein N7473_006562 [Penicillium subrubescens]|uniref:uncharacterized protein n=1 Tax=Penicillium subrubescens TaxID=1316194 RepID=UPI0025452B40|nr:uncharacterized protein N7473_006562 [Penicillium subrubescens]KAJ5890334.1 hypothetical protein N7473_006562 [Penicillium subrubescens]